MSKKSLRDAADAALRHLTGLPEWQAAGSVMVFISYAGELPTDGLVRQAWWEGKMVSAPVILPGRRLEAYGFSAWDELVPGPRQIWEPPARPGRHLTPEDLDLVIVPGLAFDRRGYRLGKGAGYYDRFLRRLPQGSVATGWTMARFLTEQLPVASHDQRVDMTVTEAGVQRWR